MEYYVYLLDDSLPHALHEPLGVYEAADPEAAALTAARAHGLAGHPPDTFAAIPMPRRAAAPHLPRLP